ncbi:MAG: acyl-CoA dehydrogenase family protein [Betaproteobacteria bacterium]
MEVDLTRDGLEPTWCLQDEELGLFATSVRRFYERNASPETVEGWRKARVVERDLWRRAAQASLLGVSMPEDYGGGGGDFRHEVAILEAQGHFGAEAFGISLHNPVVLPYLNDFGTEEQKRRWMPRLCSGEMVGAIAMTEPGTGSDLRAITTLARPTANGYSISGQKTFISNGQTANLIVLAAKVGESLSADARMSLFVIDTEQVRGGFERGRNLDKIGQEGQDTSELFFSEVEVSRDHLLGGVEGQGFQQLTRQLAQERLVIAWQSQSMTERAYAVSLAYAKERKMFGGRLIDLQNTQFVLADCKTEISVAKVFLNRCTQELVEKRLTPERAAMAKYWISEMQARSIDRCLQLFGGYGYVNDYPIARMYKDSRIHRIYGGATEVMKHLIGRTL